jgi:hypothetical protein
MIQKILYLPLLLLLGSMLHAQNAKLVGFVRDVDNFNPLSDASVVLSGTGLIAATTSDGAYLIENVPPGVYTLVGTANGFLPQEIRISARAGEEVRMDFLMRKDQNTPTKRKQKAPER